MGDKFRKPFKKRHSIVYHQGTNRVNKYLSQAIEARSVDQEKSTHVNLITLCFKDKFKERSYHEDKDRSFSIALVCSMIFLCLVSALEMIILSGYVYLIKSFLNFYIFFQFHYTIRFVSFCLCLGVYTSDSHSWRKTSGELFCSTCLC